MGVRERDRASRRWEQALLARAAQALPALRADDDPERRASNVFAVGPARSASGFPMLANDPHLSLSTPGALHVVHLTVPGVVNAIGGCVPGLPAIVTGRNERCAWGVTSLAADVVDVYADTLSDDGKRVRWQGEWIPVRTAPFDLSYKVVGVPFPIFGQERHYTPHGPVLAIDKRHHIALAARWTGALESVSLLGALGIERERDAAGICDRFRALQTPCLNVIACDRDGDVRYQAVGLLPWRRSDPGPGPIPGDAAHDWRAFVPPEQMPAWQPPRAGFVANSNNRPIGPVYPVALPRYAWAQDRALRIAERLAADRSVNVATMASIQNDIQVRAAKRVLPLLLACADSVRVTLSPRARRAIGTLRAWDFEARRDEVAPTLYRAWVGALVRRSDLRGAPGLMEAALDGRAPLALRDKDGMPERAALAATRALDLALDELSKALGGNMAGWAWSRAHRARFKHVGDSNAQFEHAPEPADGDAGTVCVGPGTLPFGTTFDFGPVFRHVVDLANADSSLGVVAPGNSGLVDGPHAGDHLARWANHTYVPFYLSWTAVETAAEDSLILRP
jgi:penicillin amidase